MKDKVKMGRKTNELGGRPRRRINVMMSEENIAKAKAKGSGNVSEGINAYMNGLRKTYTKRPLLRKEG